MSLAGVLKNILLIISSVLIWHITITPTQLISYSITLCALLYYLVGWKKLVRA